MPIDLRWFIELRQTLNVAKHVLAVPPGYRHAFKALHSTLMTDTKLRAMAGFTTCDGIELDGLTKQLNRVFHPAPQNVSTGGAKTGGSRRGMITDRQIADIVNHGVTPVELHAYTIKTLTQLQQLGLKPFAAQVDVGDRKLKLATSLDILCVDTKLPVTGTTNLVNVQLKTGYDNNYEVSQGFMLSPIVQCIELQKMEDSHFNRHKLQLMVEHLIVQMNYDNPLNYSMLLIISERPNRKFILMPEGELEFKVYENLLKRDTVSKLHLEVEAVKHAHAQRRLKEIFKAVNKNKRKGFTVKVSTPAKETKLKQVIKNVIN
jgi:hypothetical protein